MNYKPKAARVDQSATQIEMVKKGGTTVKLIVTSVLPERPTPTKNPQYADMNYIPFKDVTGTLCNGWFMGGNMILKVIGGGGGGGILKSFRANVTSALKKTRNSLKALALDMDKD